MVLKRKRKREYYKEFKIVRGVFDEHTLLILYKLLNKNKISIESLLKEGKESIVLSGLIKRRDWVAIKVYRTEACDFKTMWKYIIGDPRFRRMGKNRRIIVKLWCQREYKNLKIAFNAGVACPEPLFFSENILIMSFIGNDGSTAPRLIDIKPDDPEDVYENVMLNLNKLVGNGLIHGDLSAYNILLLDRPFFIDFSQGTTIKNPMASQLLKRDIKNVNSYFLKLNVAIKDSDQIYKELEQTIEKKASK
jgi:RIO kinase 1